jgi:hypothetical protein
VGVTSSGSFQRGNALQILQAHAKVVPPQPQALYPPAMRNNRRVCLFTPQHRQIFTAEEKDCPCQLARHSPEHVHCCMQPF